MRVVVDHVSGSRRGQRQEFADAHRISFGRHPDCTVSFDAHRDLDASSRHAELRLEEDRWILRDVGSSNGTFVGDAAMTSLILEPNSAVVVEFGRGGPKVQLWTGLDGVEPPTVAPQIPSGPNMWWWLVGLLVGLLGAMIFLKVFGAW